MARTCIDLFAGCGGLSLGLGASGFQTLIGVEAHADAFATYKKNILSRKASNHAWPEWLMQKPWRAEELLTEHECALKNLRGSVDLVAGGPPCQGFSMNGQRRPDDPRSQMVEVYLGFVELVRPRLVLLENVQGFQSMKHKTGGTYRDHVHREFDRLGYECWSELVRASDFGVPQRRPRFVLIAAPKGSLRGINPFERLRVGRRSFMRARGLDAAGVGAADAISDLLEGDEALPLDPVWGNQGFRTLVRSSTAKSAYQKLMRKGSRGQPKDMRLPRHRPDSVDRMEDILNSCERGVCLRPDDRARLGIKKRSTTPLDGARPAPTISTLPDDFIHYARPRSMTVREHARLQSFPDWFSFEGPYTTGGKRRKDACPKFTQVGNAVPPLLAEAIGAVLIGLLDHQAADDVPHLRKIVNVGSKGLANSREVPDLNVLTSA